MLLRTIVLGLVPGVAHVDQGRILRGLVYFFLFAFLLNGALLAPLIATLPQARRAGLVAAAGLWLVALIDAIRKAGRRSPSKAPVPPEAPPVPPPSPVPERKTSA